ncbi:hypothetical protein DFH09DRAFT_915705, partial [Mycena vulgaris]
FLLAYSPDFNPIELAFSAIKAYVCRMGIIGRANLEAQDDNIYVYLHLLEASFSISGKSAVGWFHHCGYIQRLL